MTQTEHRLSARTLGYKVEWEGGIVSTLEYGIRSDDIDDPELAALWGLLQDFYDRMRPLIVETHRLLDAARRPDEPSL